MCQWKHCVAVLEIFNEHSWPTEAYDFHEFFNIKVKPLLKQGGLSEVEDKPCYSFMSKVTKGDYDNMQSRRTEFAINETQRGATNEKKDNVLVIDVDGKSAGKLTKKEHERLMESVFLRKQKDLNSKPYKEGKGTKVSVASLNHDFQRFGSMDGSRKHETDKTLQNTACELLT